ncbi:MAG: 3'-5' exonuclease [Magnetovibrionaceae bacterium]
MYHKSLLVFDIETVPDTDAVPNLTGFDDPDVTARRDELERYHLEVTQGRNAFPRQCFHKIVCISFLLAEIERDGPQERYFLQEVRSGGKTDSSEAELVEGFLNFINKHQPRLVSFNGRGFDLPVIKYRAMAHGLSAGVLFQSGPNKWENYQSRYAQDWHCDLIEVLSDYGASARLRLNEVAAILGAPGKFGTSGGDVAALFDDGLIDDIRDYCETDVLNTYLVYLRWALLTGRLSGEAHDRAIADVIALIQGEGAERPHLLGFLEAWGEASDNRMSRVE